MFTGLLGNEHVAVSYHYLACSWLTMNARGLPTAALPELRILPTFTDLVKFSELAWIILPKRH